MLTLFKKGAFRFALVCPSVRKFCYKEGEVEASVSYGHISSLKLKVLIDWSVGFLSFSEMFISEES